MVQLLGLTILNTYNKQPTVCYDQSDCISTLALGIFDKLGLLVAEVQRSNI